MMCHSINPRLPIKIGYSRQELTNIANRLPETTKNFEIAVRDLYTLILAI